MINSNDVRGTKNRLTGIIIRDSKFKFCLKLLTTSRAHPESAIGITTSIVNNQGSDVIVE